MPANKRARVKGRGETGRFVAIPHSVLQHPDYQSLTGAAVKVLIAMLTQYNGRNNGDLCLAPAVMRSYGFRSSDTLNTAKKQLLKHGLIIETRPGRFTNPGGICALYAVTWQPIDECNGKIDIAPTAAPPRSFSVENQTAKEQQNTLSENRSQSLRQPDRYRL
ncbi:MAG: hypothetical protein CMI03_19775 [Oceanospirillaceae bacterium]|nr:hypothetical protein [Oceanospirillaceae bacterium]|tara:strand:- start:209 stop:697 length:489 start_codon:yes stop_codon:yes gene_type:complete